MFALERVTAVEALSVLVALLSCNVPLLTLVAPA